MKNLKYFINRRENRDARTVLGPIHPAVPPHSLHQVNFVAVLNSVRFIRFKTQDKTVIGLIFNYRDMSETN